MSTEIHLRNDGSPWNEIQKNDGCESFCAGWGRLGLYLAEETPDSGVVEIWARGIAPFRIGAA